MIAERMKQKNLSLRAVSKLSGVSPCTVMRIAQGVETVSFINYLKVLKALGLKFTIEEKKP